MTRPELVPQVQTLHQTGDTHGRHESELARQAVDRRDRSNTQPAVIPRRAWTSAGIATRARPARGTPGSLQAGSNHDSEGAILHS